MILFHDTASIITLYSILNTGMLKSPAALNSLTSSEDPDFIFFSPATDDYVFEIPSQVLILDFDAVLGKYQKFFINSSNMYGPIDGTNRKDKNCECIATFYSDKLLQTEKNKLNSGDKPCLIGSLNKMISDYVLKFPQNDYGYYNRRLCEGGPEVGIYENNVELDGCLRSLRIRHINDYLSNDKLCKTVINTLNISMEELYKQIIDKTLEFGAEVIIYEPTKPIKGGKNLKKSIINGVLNDKRRKTIKKHTKNRKKIVVITVFIDSDCIHIFRHILVFSLEFIHRFDILYDMNRRWGS